MPQTLRQQHLKRIRFLCPDEKHRSGIVKLITLPVYSGRDADICGNSCIADLLQKLHVPCRAGLIADGKLALDGFAFKQHLGGHGAVRVLGWQLVYVFIATVMSVIRIEIEQDTAAFEDAEPLRIRLFRVGKRPGEVAGEDHIKGIIGKRRILRIHTEKFRGRMLFARKLSCVKNHVLRQINAGGVVTKCGEHEGKHAGSAADIKNFK